MEWEEFQVATRLCAKAQSKSQPACLTNRKGEKQKTPLFVCLFFVTVMCVDFVLGAIGGLEGM